MSLLEPHDWRNVRRGMAAATAFGACVVGGIAGLLLWLEGLEGGDL